MIRVSAFSGDEPSGRERGPLAKKKGAAGRRPLSLPIPARATQHRTTTALRADSATAELKDDRDRSPLDAERVRLGQEGRDCRGEAHNQRSHDGETVPICGARRAARTLESKSRAKRTGARSEGRAGAPARAPLQRAKGGMRIANRNRTRVAFREHGPLRAKRRTAARARSRAFHRAGRPQRWASASVQRRKR